MRKAVIQVALLLSIACACEAQESRKIVYNGLPNEITVSVDTFKDVALIEWKMKSGEAEHGYKFIWGRKYKKYKKQNNYIFTYLANQLHFEMDKSK